MVVVGLVAAIALRVFAVAGPMGALDSDEAVSGLMARHILEGELPVFYWAQNYGGTGEVFMTAAVFAVLDSSTAALRAVPLVLFLLAAFLLWRIGKRWFAEPGASVGALLFIVWPGYLVWKSVQGHGYYGFLVVTAVAALLLAYRLDDQPTTPRYALLGLALGLGWWTSPQMVLVGAPVIVWLVARRQTRRWKGLVALAAGVVLGAAPWLIWNVANDWASLTGDFQLPHSTYASRLTGLFTEVIPAGVGIRVPGGKWFFPGWTKWIFYSALLAAFLWFVIKSVRTRDPRLLLLSGIALAFPWLYAISPHTWFVAEPRYLLLLYPVICLVLGWSFSRSYTVRLFTTALAIPLSALGIVALNAHATAAPDIRTHPHRDHLGAVIDVLRDHDERYVIADYWIAYPISFETREQIIATSSGHVRYPAHDALVRSQPHPAYVFFTGEENQHGYGTNPDYISVVRSEYTVYVYDPSSGS